MKVHEALARVLRAQGIDEMFGVIGDGNLWLVNSFQSLGGAYIAATHEAVATCMADGYARTARKIGVATVTQGPGLGNTINGLREAVKNATPMILLSGAVPVGARGHVQEMDQRALVLAVGAGYESVRSTITAQHDLTLALHRAAVERRPIVLDIPNDLAGGDVEYVPVIASKPLRVACTPDPEALDDALGLIASARRPLVLAGRGAVGARESLLALADRLGAPVATTLPAKDLFGPRTFDLGIFGTYAELESIEPISRADCVIVFGAGLNDHTTDHGALLKGKRVVHCDISVEAIGRWSRADVGVVGDAALTAREIVAFLDAGRIEPTGFRDEVERHLADRSEPAPSPDSGTPHLDVRRLLAELDEIVPDDRVLVFDSGRFGIAALRGLHAEPPFRVMGGQNSGCVGLGMSFAVGAAVADRTKTVVAVVGDGGFMLGGLGAFNDAARHEADVIVILLNDGCYGAEYVQLAEWGTDPAISLFNWPDFAELAGSLGGTGVTVRSLADLPTVETAVAGRGRPLLIDVRLDPAHVPWVHGVRG